VDETWSGLRCVIRVADRPRPGARRRTVSARRWGRNRRLRSFHV